MLATFGSLTATIVRPLCSEVLHPHGAKGSQGTPKRLQRSREGPPRNSQDVPKIPKRPPKAPTGVQKWCAEISRSTLPKRNAGFARDSSESTRIEVELLFSHKKMLIQTVFVKIFAERRSRSSLALVWRVEKQSLGP